MKADEKGQALLEVLIGVTMLAVVMVTLLYAFQAGISGTGRVGSRSAAIGLAQSQMEYIKSQPYQVYDDDGNPVEGDGYSLLEGETLPAGFTADHVEFSVGNLGNETSPEAIQLITIAVTYGDNVVTLSDYNRSD